MEPLDALQWCDKHNLYPIWCKVPSKYGDKSIEVYGTEKGWQVDGDSELLSSDKIYEELDLLGYNYTDLHAKVLSVVAGDIYLAYNKYLEGCEVFGPDYIQSYIAQWQAFGQQLKECVTTTLRSTFTAVDGGVDD